MRLGDISSKCGLEAVYIADENFEITKGYTCDLMSEVIGKAETGAIWVTVHNNMNVLGVAVMIDIKAVVIAEGHEITEQFLDKAREEGISLFKTNENGFNITGKLYSLGIR